jgi:integrase
LALRLRRTGGKSFYFLDRGRRERLGRAADYTVAEARKKAEWAIGEFNFEKLPAKLRRSMRIEQAASEYLKQRPMGSSDWFKTVESLFSKHLIPRFGSRPLASVRKDQWLLLIEKTALEQRSRGVNLHKSLRSFLSWAVQHGLIEANPLAKTSLDLIRLPFHRKCPIKIDDLCAIYDAAQKLGYPWGAMVGLVILTGEGIEIVRQLRRRDIDFQHHTWTVTNHGRVGRRPYMRVLSLPAAAMDLLAPYQKTDGYLFPSPRKSNLTPINFHIEIVEKLRAMSSVRGNWRMRDIKEGALHQIGRFDGLDAHSAWAKKFSRELFRYGNPLEGAIL